MKMIRKAADRVVELFVPQTTASADQGYWEYDCTTLCGTDPWNLNWEKYRRYCRESWCTRWEDLGCIC